MSYEALTNEELVGLIQGRDEQALACLLGRNLQLAIAKAYRHLNDYHESEEVAFKVFHQIWDKSECLDFTNGNRFLGWLTVAVCRRAIDHARARIAYCNALNRHELAFTEEDGYENHEYIKDFIAIGEGIIARLPNLQRQAMELTFQGMTEREIARKLGKSRSTIHQAVNGAKRNIKSLTPANLN